MSVSQVDGDDDVTIYVKTGSYFYCRTNCPVPDRCIESVESSTQKKEPVLKSMKSKSAKKGKSKKFSKTKRVAEQKTGYEFGP